MELWERSAALALLDDLLRVSAQGGRVAVLAGEAGIGKTVLTAEFARRCGAKARVLWGGCDPLVTPRVLGPLYDIGREVGGPLAARLTAGAAPEELLEAFLDEISGPRQRPRPVVVIEDVHWADGATLDWLALLGRRIGRLPALLVLTYRDDEVGTDHPLRGTLAGLPSAIVRRVPLPQLSRTCVTEHARRAGRDANLVYRLAGGNPLLVTELLKVDGRAVPASVQDLILARLQGLPAPARELAQLVSVVPTRAETAIVAGQADLVDVCVEAGVLVAAADGVSFRHDLLRTAVEDSLPPARRVALHARVLDILAGIDGADPGRLVHHATLAQDRAAVLRWGRIAAEGAARQGAHREAAAHYRAASFHADLLPVPERAEMLEAYAFEAYLAGLGEEGLRIRRTALGIRESLGQREQVGENLRWISRLAWWTGHAGAAREAGERAVAVLEAGPPGRQLAMAYSNQSQLHMLAGEHDDAIAWGQRARDLAGRLGDAETSIHATINVDTARLESGEQAAASALAEAHERAAAHGLVDHAARALVNLATTLAWRADFVAATPAVERALAYATEQDLDGYVQYLLGVRAELRLARCDWTGALEDAAAALERPARMGVAIVPALVAQARIQTARGDPAALSTLDEAYRQAERTGEFRRIGPVAAARSEYFLLHGDAARAAEEARHGLAVAGSTTHPFQIGELAYRLRRAGGTEPAPNFVPAPYRMLMAGDWAGAAAEWQRRGGTYARVEALAHGDPAAADEALRVLTELGAGRAADALRADLRRRGFTRVPRGPRRTTTANVAGLTPRQADVLALLAEGLTNADIAERLTLSAKTVDHHVSAVLSKLGVTSRGRAAAVARQLAQGGSAN